MKNNLFNAVVVMFAMVVAGCPGPDDGTDGGNDGVCRGKAVCDAGSTGSGSGSDGGSGADGGCCDGGFVGLPGTAVNLGKAGEFAILAKTGVSTVPGSNITGNVGVSPAAATYITGFSLIADSSNTFSRSTQVTGQVFAANYTAPTPSRMTTSVSNMETAFTDASGRAAGVTELGAGNISGRTLSKGVYKWGTGLLMTTDVTLDGSATDVFVFQIAKDLTMSSGAKIHLTGGVLSKNVFWQVSGKVDLGTTAHIEGIVLSQTSITLHTGASANGRLLAQTAVIIDHSVIVQP